MEARILYWGPSASGKTEALTALRAVLDPGGRGMLYSLASEDGSTAYFDVLPVEEFRFGGQRMRVAVCAVPGSADRAPERRALLRDADAIVFLADAHRAALAENRASAQELESTLEELGRRRNETPVVWCFNKQDGDEVIPTRELREMLVPGTDPVYETIATTSHGIFESFRETFRLLLQNLARRHGLEPEPEDRDGLPEQLLPQLARQYGSGNGNGHARPAGDRTLQLPVPSDGMAEPERAVESMLLMAQQHAALAERMRQVEARNTELMAVNRVARSILSAMEIDNLLVVLLDSTLERLRMSHAGVVIFDPSNEGALKTHVTGFGRDPALAIAPQAARKFFDLLRDSDGPIPADRERNRDLYDALGHVDSRIDGAIFQPVKMHHNAPSGWIAIYRFAEEEKLSSQGLLFLSSIARLASLGLDKIAQFDALARDRETNEADAQELTAKLEMAQARVRALNRGLESRVRERTHAVEEKLARVRKDAAESAHRARMRGMASLAASFSEEVGKPVSDVAGRLDEMRARLEDLRGASGEDAEVLVDALEKLVDKCVRAVERVGGVASSLTRVTGRDEGDEGDEEIFSLNAAVADAVTLLERRTEGCAELDLRLGKIPEIPGDETELSQVVVAVITNALEAIERTGRRGKITITTFADLEGATLRVSDDGDGIEPELLARICEPFVTTKSGQPGAGLGLHAAQSALEAQGGSIRVKSRAGEGTSASILFALSPVSAART